MQAGGGAGGSIIGSILPLFLIFGIFYWLLIRPQNQRMKQHRQMLSEITRGDVIVTGGGLVGKVTKVNDDELTVDLDGTKVRVVRAMVADVRNKPEPANDRSANSKTKAKK